MAYICNCDGGLTETQIHDFFKEASKNGAVIKRLHDVKRQIKGDARISFCRSSSKDHGCISQLKTIQMKYYPSTLPHETDDTKDKKSNLLTNIPIAFVS